jgi:hypothetical protein
VSRLLELADRLRAIGEQLPIGQVAGAAGRLRTASGLLAWVMHASSQPTGTPSLSVAGEHLDRAAGAMLAAQEALSAYLIAIGLPRDGVPPENRDWHATLAPAQPARPPRRPGEQAQLAHFWADRVDALTDQVGAARPDRDKATASSAELLHRGTARALDEDRDRLRRELAAADPAVGLGLAAITPPLLRHLAAELIGHPPRAEDLPVVRRAAAARLGTLLPKLPPGVAEELLVRACHAVRPEDVQRAERDKGGGPAGLGGGRDKAGGPAGLGGGRDTARDPSHPVDTAVAGVVLIAGLLAATGRSADDLAAVTEELRRRTEGERKRAQLRRQAADEIRSGRPLGRANEPPQRPSEPPRAGDPARRNDPPVRANYPIRPNTNPHWPSGGNRG